MLMLAFPKNSMLEIRLICYVKATPVKLSLCDALHRCALAKCNSHRETPFEIKEANGG